MKQGTPIVQIVLLSVFGLAVVFAMLIFSGKIPLGGAKSQQSLSGSLVVWGTLPTGDVVNSFSAVNATYKDVRMDYSEKDPKTFQSDLVNALASGTGPDIVMISPSDVVTNHDRLSAVPFASLPESVFKDTFIDQGSLFVDDTGVLAFPFVVDPLVMFSNRDMLSSAFVVAPPRTWDELVSMNQKISVRDDGGALSAQTVALGSYDNVTHAKDVLAMLINQAGNSIVAWDAAQKKYVSKFSETDGKGVSGVVNALAFFMSFSNPSDAAHYSWNPSLPSDRDQFVSGRLAFYFGYASEIESIRRRNPNLNFAVSMVPQRSGVPTKAAYGTMTGVAILKASKNQSLALAVAQALVSKDSISAYLGESPKYAPARRDMLASPSDDAVMTTIYNSAIISKSFLDPDPEKTSALFRKYVDQIRSGLSQPESIISAGNSLISDILEKAQRR